MVMCAALQRDVTTLEHNAAQLDGSRVLIYHVAEGIPGSVVHDEFVDLVTAQCLRPGFIGVHATALTTDDFGSWQQAVTKIGANERGTVVWSPFSNLWLYQKTTDVLEADARGLRIALGADWSPSGTKHVLGELKVADSYNSHTLHGHFTDRQLCDMVTANPGDALATAWGPQIGRLQHANAADLVVVERHHEDVYRNLIAATEPHLLLVMVRGRPFYGTTALMNAAGATDTNSISIAGVRRSVAVRQPGAKSTLDWPGVTRALGRVRADPVAAWRQIPGRTGSLGWSTRRSRGAAGAVRRHAGGRVGPDRRRPGAPRRPRDTAAGCTDTRCCVLCSDQSHGTGRAEAPCRLLPMSADINEPRRALPDSVSLADFLDETTRIPLGLASRRQLVAQARVLLEDLYVHVPLKRAM